MALQGKGPRGIRKLCAQAYVEIMDLDDYVSMVLWRFGGFRFNMSFIQNALL